MVNSGHNMPKPLCICWIILVGLLTFRVTGAGAIFRRVNATKELRIAWLAPRKTYHEFNASTSVGGLLLALWNIIEQPSWLKGYNLNVHWFDSDCSSKEALAVAVKAKVTFHPHVFIGPPCSEAMRGVAQLASSWNLPIFGWISGDIDLSDKETFSTLVRLQGPLDTIVTTMRYISRMFKWNRFALIYDHQSRYEAVEKAILSGQEKAGYYMTSSHKVSILSSDYEVKNIFKQIRKYARIIIFAVPWMDMRKYMLIAYELEMAGGDFAFLCMHSDVYIGKRFSEEVVSDRGWRRGDKDDKKARVAFESVLHIINPTLSKEFYQNYQKRISELDYKKEDSNLPAITSVDAYTPFLFDATMVWAFLANKTIAKNIDPKNGSHIFEEAKYFESDGLTQAIALDEKGDRLSNIWILDMVAEGQFQVVMEIYNQASGGKLTTGKNQSGDVRWGRGKYGRENAPRDEPVCGFEGDLCPENKQNNIRIFFPVVMTVSVAVGLILCGFACHRSFYLKRIRNERPAWKVDPEEIMFKQTIDEGNLRSSFMSLGRRRSSKKNQSRKQKNGLDNYGLDLKECPVDGMGHQEIGDQTTGKSGELIPYPPMECVYCNAAIIRGGVVYAKKISGTAVTFNECDQHLLSELVEIKHSNIAMFVGVCDGPGPAYIFGEYCSKGSLSDIIKNMNIRLDDMFKFALCQDIAKGLDFLHKSEVREHGNLKSCNCLVDSRWACKLVDFGLRFLKRNKPIEERIAHTPSELYWTPPEVLRDVATGYRVKADMYAFGVIIKEVFTRKSPYQEYGLSSSEVIKRVKNGPKLDNEVFRPLTDMVRDSRSKSEGSTENGSLNAAYSLVRDPGDAPAGYYTDVFQLARGCWSEDPSNRPAAGRVYKALLRLNPNRNLSMIDNMVGLLETYANHLEDLVVDRTEALNVEKSKVETLLFKLLPKEVAQTLKSGKDVKAEFFEESSIYFSDIVGFTKICAQSSPIEVVNLLNLLYQTFDNLIERFDVYKVETIGDAYMIASGVPKRNGKQHIKEIVDCAIDLLNSISRVKIPHMPSRHLKIRIGIHSGAVVGGVVGNKMPRYCLFGDTVNVASRMESTGVPMRIHMSSFAKSVLDAFPGYETECRGEIEVKGKGLMTTYFVIGSQESRVHACNDNDVETLQESTDSISKMATYKMNQELMYLLSLKDNKESSVSEASISTCDLDSIWGSYSGDNGQRFSSLNQTNEWRYPKNVTNTKGGNSVVTFGGCSLMMNRNYQRNPEMLTYVVDENYDKKQKSKVDITEMPVCSILKNGSQQQNRNEAIIDTARTKRPETKRPETKYPKIEANRNTESVTLEIDNIDFFQNNRCDDVIVDIQKGQMSKELAKEHSYQIEEMGGKSTSPQTLFPGFQNQKVLLNPNRNSLNEKVQHNSDPNTITQKKQKVQQNPNPNSLKEKVQHNHDPNNIPKNQKIQQNPNPNSLKKMVLQNSDPSLKDKKIERNPNLKSLNQKVLQNIDPNPHNQKILQNTDCNPLNQKVLQNTDPKPHNQKVLENSDPNPLNQKVLQNTDPNPHNQKVLQNSDPNPLNQKVLQNTDPNPHNQKVLQNSDPNPLNQKVLQNTDPNPLNQKVLQNSDPNPLNQKVLQNTDPNPLNQKVLQNSDPNPHNQKVLQNSDPNPLNQKVLQNSDPNPLNQKVLQNTDPNPLNQKVLQNTDPNPLNQKILQNTDPNPLNQKVLQNTDPNPLNQKVLQNTDPNPHNQKVLQNTDPNPLNQKVLQNSDPNPHNQKVLQNSNPNPLNQKVLQNSDPNPLNQKVLQNSDPNPLNQKVLQNSDPNPLNQKVLQNTDPNPLNQKVLQNTDPNPLNQKVLQNTDPNPLNQKVLQNSDPNPLNQKVLQNSDPNPLNQKVLQNSDPNPLNQKVLQNTGPNPHNQKVLQNTGPNPHNQKVLQNSDPLNQKTQQNSSINKCTDKSNHEMNFQQNQRLSMDKVGSNHDVANNYANNFKNFNKFANPLISPPPCPKLVSSAASTDKVDLPNVVKCSKSASPTHTTTNYANTTPITYNRKITDSPDESVRFTNLNTFNKLGVGSTSDGLPSVVTCQPYLWCGTDEDKSVVENITNLNHEMTSL